MMLMWILSWLPVVFVHAFTIAGVIVFFGLKLIPSMLPGASVYLEQIKLISIVVMVLGVWLEGAHWAAQDVQAELDKEKAKVAEMQSKSSQVTVQTITKYVDKVRYIEKKGKDRVEYVDKVITVKDNADCKLPDSWFVLINSGAENTDAGATGKTDGETTGEVKNNP